MTIPTGLRTHIILAVVLLAACAKTPVALTSPDAGRLKVKLLTETILQLPGQPDPDEAGRIANAAVYESARMYREFEVDASPRLHNLMINLGMRERGLCYQWADDLYAALSALNLKNYDLHPAVAHRGSLFLEHSSVVLTASGEPFEKGIVFDAWRNSGDLFWARVGSDEYEWRPWSESANDSLLTRHQEQ